MKAFEFNEDYSQFRYPEDMIRISEYLNERGRVNVSAKRLEKLYEQYSEDCWEAGWLFLDDYILCNFADWLSEQDI